jgi:hypothetical protein
MCREVTSPIKGDEAADCEITEEHAARESVWYMETSESMEVEDAIGYRELAKGFASCCRHDSIIFSPDL